MRTNKRKCKNGANELHTDKTEAPTESKQDQQIAERKKTNVKLPDHLKKIIRSSSRIMGIQPTSMLSVRLGELWNLRGIKVF